MSRMVSSAGEMEVIITGMSVDRNQVRIEGRLGVWESQIYFTLDDIAHMIRLMLNLSVILFILRLPILYVGRRLLRKAES